MPRSLPGLIAGGGSTMRNIMYAPMGSSTRDDAPGFAVHQPGRAQHPAHGDRPYEIGGHGRLQRPVEGQRRGDGHAQEGEEVEEAREDLHRRPDRRHAFGAAGLPDGQAAHQVVAIGEGHAADAGVGQLQQQGADLDREFSG